MTPPSQWVLVISFPSDDYFGAVLTSARTTLGLGLFALCLGFVLLYFSRRLIPTMDRLKALVAIRAKEVRCVGLHSMTPNVVSSNHVCGTDRTHVDIHRKLTGTFSA